jgi:hypothetical protein
MMTGSGSQRHGACQTMAAGGDGATAGHQLSPVVEQDDAVAQ